MNQQLKKKLTGLLQIQHGNESRFINFHAGSEEVLLKFLGVVDSYQCS